MVASDTYYQQRLKSLIKDEYDLTMQVRIVRIETVLHPDFHQDAKLTLEKFIDVLIERDGDLLFSRRVDTVEFDKLVSFLATALEGGLL